MIVSFLPELSVGLMDVESEEMVVRRIVGLVAPNGAQTNFIFVFQKA